jgi:hypothetical protein
MRCVNCLRRLMTGKPIRNRTDQTFKDVPFLLQEEGRSRTAAGREASGGSAGEPGVQATTGSGTQRRKATGAKQ